MGHIYAEQCSLFHDTGLNRTTFPISLSDIGRSLARNVPGVVIAAVRDLDPPAGGAEMSLATLLIGVSEPGPLSNADALYIPCQKSPNLDPGILEQGWRITSFQSGDRGDITSLTSTSEIERNIVSLPIEDFWSGVAWRRKGKNGQPHNKSQSVFYTHLTLPTNREV